LKQGSLISKLVALLATAGLIVVGLMFSAVLLVFIVSAGLVAFGYIWWKTRTLRRQMREHKQAMASAANDADAFKGEVFEGEIIEGEVTRRVISIEEFKR
jgi:flagellar biosynthesis component FlhA